MTEQHATIVDPKLAEWGTETQALYINAINEHGGFRAAAKALGVNNGTVSRSISGLKARAALRGYAPEHGLNDPQPDPFLIRGSTTLTDLRSGEKILRWIRASPDDERMAEIRKEMLAAFAEDVPELWCPDGPTEFSSDVIPWIQIGDAHVGMLAHSAETGESFDLKIAETELLAAIGQVIDEMPACERCVINDLGDFTHYDNLAAVTAASGHALDADGRHPKMIRVYSRIMRTIVEMALTKAQHVDVIINQGNHSRINDFWMRELLDFGYGHTGRVHVLNNDSVFIGYRMGATFVMTHHSDKCSKPDRLVSVMANDFSKDWGESTFRYIDTGHVHHSRSIEAGGAVIESWNILAPNDKWGDENGYRSRRALSVVLRSRTYGELGRRVLGTKEIRDRLASKGVFLKAPGKPVHTV